MRSKAESPPLGPIRTIALYREGWQEERGEWVVVGREREKKIVEL